jgi:hypothetical protein
MNDTLQSELLAEKIAFRTAYVTGGSFTKNCLFNIHECQVLFEGCHIETSNALFIFCYYLIIPLCNY